MEGEYQVTYIDSSEFNITDEHPELQAVAQMSQYEVQRCGNRFRSVFLDDGLVIANAEIVKQEEVTAFIIEFKVEEDFRSMSVGSILLEAIETALQAEGVKRVFVDDINNKIEFFVKNGYTLVQGHYTKDLSCVSISADQS